MKPTLIIVDDMKHIRESLLSSLSEDFDVLDCVASGQEALEAVRTHQPQLLLMDVVMPQMSGIEAARMILGECTPAPTIIMLSGLKEENIVLQAFEAGVADYLVKPVEPETLRKVLKEAAKSAA
jgi:CheY-like chemotaxis protein